jgi:GNAT superfamily N-acetyltransferase
MADETSELSGASSGPVLEAAPSVVVAPTVDLADEYFIQASRAAVAAAFHDARRWRAWWPDLALVVHEDRGEDGVRWVVSGRYAGTSEVWLEALPVAGRPGTRIHYFLKVDPVRRGQPVASPVPSSVAGWRRRQKVAEARRLAWKQALHRLKDELEEGRLPGEPGVPPAPAS